MLQEEKSGNPDHLRISVRENEARHRAESSVTGVMIF
jgi:hypothetical protein